MTTENIIILLFTELGFFLLCYILWKVVFKPVLFLLQLFFIFLWELLYILLTGFRGPVPNCFLVESVIFLTVYHYFFVIVGTWGDITCSWQSHFITFTKRFLTKKLEFLVKVFKSLVPALKTVCSEFLKFHNSVTSEIESFLRTFIASSNGSDYTEAGMYVLEFFKFPNDVTSNIRSFLHSLIVSSNESVYTWAGISVLLFVIFIYGCIWCGVIWSKVFTVVFELISAPYVYVYSILESLQYDEVLSVIVGINPSKALVYAFIKIFQGVYSDVTNLLVIFPFEQYSWFYLFLFIFFSWVYRKIMDFLWRNPEFVVMIFIIIWVASGGDGSSGGGGIFIDFGPFPFPGSLRY